MHDSLLRTDNDIIEIYNRHINTVYKVCFMFLKNVQDTEDAVQTIFIKLMRSGKVFESDEHEKAWLIVTAQNYCKNVLRHWWRSKSVDIESLHEDAFLKDGNQENVDNQEYILQQILALPFKYKTVVYLYYYEGYSSVEIAKMLDAKESTIRSWLFTGRRLLKISIGGENE